MAASVVRWIRSRASDLVILAIYLGALAFVYVHFNNLDSRRVYENCLAIENIKSGQREDAEKAIAATLRFIRDYDRRGAPLPFPRASLDESIAAQQAIIDRYPPRNCKK